MFSPSFAQQLLEAQLEGPAAAVACPGRVQALPDLQQAPMRAVWRKRAAEFEEAEHVGSGGRGTRLMLRSLVGSPGGPLPAAIEFHNASQRKVR